MKTIAITVKGKVQGVGFRYFVLRHATAIGVSGFVKNLPNGDVYIEVSGTSKQLEQLILLCNQGPAHSNVESIQVTDIQKSFDITGFRIIG
ncbi:MAG TPA: acylphosphatase [Bacteroidales bacterium]|nr:acylphosphatase [Bacteroidales bacterium]